MKYTKRKGLNITLNHELLSNIIRGHLSNYYDKKLTTSDINTIIEYLIDSIDYFMNVDEIKLC